METYNNPAEYKGKEWDELLRAMSPRDIKRTIKTAYRRVGKQIADIARSDLAGAIRHGNKMKGNVRVRVYPRGSGFMVTVKPHGKQGYYKRSQDGKEKPVAMWAQDGTVERYTRHGNNVYKTADGQYFTMKGNYTGRMPRNDFLKRANDQAPAIIENGIRPELENAVYNRAKKLGWTD